MAEKYRPDVVLISVYAEDDIVPLNGSTGERLHMMRERLRELGIRVYYSFSLFSRSMHEEVKNTDLPYEEYVHLANYARFVREQKPEEYERLFGYFRRHGVDPEELPRVERKPVDGFYIEPGHYTTIDPLYRPYREYIKAVIREMVNISRPDGLAFDHIRFFTFDEGYNQDIRDWILNWSGLDIATFTPRPPFQLGENWTTDDRRYYDGRAEVIRFAAADILSAFPDYPAFGTTIGMIDPARANGQYVELQAQLFDGLLLMEYSNDGATVENNLKKTVEKVGPGKIILGVRSFGENVGIPLESIRLAGQYRIAGVYLLGYRFPAEVHERLLRIRGL